MQVYVGRNGEKFGPYSIDQVNEFIKQGKYSFEDLGWHEGMEEWKPLRTIAGVIEENVIPISGSSSPNKTSPTEQVPSHLVWGILATLCCCLPLGIVSIVHASKVEGLLAAGDIEKAKENSKKAAMWAWISFGISIIGGIIWGILGAFGAFAEGFEGAY